MISLNAPFAPKQDLWYSSTNPYIGNQEFPLLPVANQSDSGNNNNAITTTTSQIFADLSSSLTQTENHANPRIIKISQTRPTQNSTIVDFKPELSYIDLIEQIKIFWELVPKDLNGDNVVILSSEGKYIGPVRDGRGSEIGSIVVCLGSYKGGFKNGLPNGVGVLNGFSQKLSGEFIAGMMQGKCTGKFIKTSQFEDKVIDGKLDTVEVMNLPHPFEIVEATFTNGQPTHAHIKWYDANSWIFSRYNEYEGDIKDWEFNGKGTYTSGYGEKYNGMWKNGLRDGEGFCKYVNGTEYSGQWKENKCHGKGAFYTTSYRFYGEWISDLRQGEFTVYTSTPSCITEKWIYKNDKVVKRPKDGDPGIFNFDSHEYHVPM